MSAPQIDFTTDIPKSGRVDIVNKNRVPLSSTDANDNIGENFRTVDEALPGQTIGDAGFATEESTASVANMQTEDSYNQYVEFKVNPLTGKKEKTLTVIKSNTNRKGETVLREIDI